MTWKGRAREGGGEEEEKGEEGERGDRSRWEEGRKKGRRRKKNEAGSAPVLVGAKPPPVT